MYTMYGRIYVRKNNKQAISNKDQFLLASKMANQHLF